MKKLNLLLLISILAIFTGCKKDNASTDSGNSGGGGNETVYNIGDYYDVNGVKGVVYKISDDGRHGMIVSMDEPYGFRKWSTENVETGATYPDSGLSNMNIIVSNYDLEQYPAFKWCQEKNTNGVTGWYLPAYYEFRDVNRVASIVNDTLSYYGGAEILDVNYWTSTEDGKNRATGFPSIGCSKSEYYRVRAVHSF